MISGGHQWMWESFNTRLGAFAVASGGVGLDWTMGLAF
jgi:hypothetical protein